MDINNNTLSTFDYPTLKCVQQGWQCPICNRVYSPYTPMCYYCGQASKTHTSTGVTINGVNLGETHES